jgi:propanediol dehydratase small subunit
MKAELENSLDDEDIKRKESRRNIEDLTIDSLRQGKLTPHDVTIRKAQLIAQAEYAEQKGYGQLARNFRRAAELTNLPNEVLMAVYEKLRPNRSTYGELLSTSQELIARYDAPETGSYVREAAEVYRERGLLKQEA